MDHRPKGKSYTVSGRKGEKLPFGDRQRFLRCKKKNKNKNQTIHQ